MLRMILSNLENDDSHTGETQLRRLIDDLESEVKRHVPLANDEPSKLAPSEAYLEGKRDGYKMALRTLIAR